MDLWYGTSGPRDARIVLVGEAWGREEALEQKPFMGTSGNELTRILAEAGIQRDEVLLTNVVAEQPEGNNMWKFFHHPDEKMAELRGLHPRANVLAGTQRLKEQLDSSPRSLIICAGNYPLWALTSCTGFTTSAKTQGVRVPSGIMSWRGSMWYGLDSQANTPLLPIIHPAAILRQWELRAVTVHDLKSRVPMAIRGDWRPNPKPLYWAPPTFEQARSKLQHWITRADAGERFAVVCDIETAKKLITCIGFTDSINFGMSIPFVKLGPARQFLDYWPHNQEVALLALMVRVLSHPNIEIVGQNFVYDIQYIHKYLGIRPNLRFDTMLAQHLCWPGISKGLDYISSLYCQYHWYWKDDGKEWNVNGTLEQHLVYNCDDLVRTYEAMLALKQLISKLGLDRQWEETMERNHLALRMMERGVKIDKDRRSRLGRELGEVQHKLDVELDIIIPDCMIPRKKGSKKTPWYNSPKIQKFVFGEMLGMRLPKSRDTGNDTLNKEALRDLARRYPEFTGIFTRLEAKRSIGVYLSHFIRAPLDVDDRMRCSFNTSGTETFRWSSSKNPFGVGANLQTIPAGDED